MVESVFLKSNRVVTSRLAWSTAFLTSCMSTSETTSKVGMGRRYRERSQGSVPEWPKGADCKSAGTAFDGSNPSRPTGKPRSRGWSRPLAWALVATMTEVKTVLLGPPPPELEAFLERRRALGQDGFDEVWDGVYHVAPMAHAWHGYLDNVLAVLLDPYARAAGLVGIGAFNLGEPDNFRVPDRGYHRRLPSAVWVPSASIVVEVISPDDETWQKFDFYARHSVEEICTADPIERRLQWFRLMGESYADADRSELLNVNIADLAARIDWPN